MTILDALALWQRLAARRWMCPERETLGGPHPRTPIMRRLDADRGDNPDPGILNLGDANTSGRATVPRLSLRTSFGTDQPPGWIRQ